MKRSELEHIVRAAAKIVEDEIVVIGSQAAVGQVDEPPEQLLVSMEADVFPLRAPERAIEIDGAIGDGSQFHEQYGYYAHGVGPETAHAPAGWEGRAHKVVLPPQGGWKTEAVAHYMGVDDVVLAKLVAGRAKDFEYVEAALRFELVEVEDLQSGLELMVNNDRRRAETNLEIIVARLP